MALVFYGRIASMNMRWQVSPKEHSGIFQTDIHYLLHLRISGSEQPVYTNRYRSGPGRAPAA